VVAASLLHRASGTRTVPKVSAAAAASAQQFSEAFKAAWHNDTRVQALSQRCLAHCHSRWAAGTLLALTPEEAAFFSGHWRPNFAGAEVYLLSAEAALLLWPPSRTAEEEEARVRGVLGALRVTLELDARGDWDRYPRLDTRSFAAYRGNAASSESNPAVLAKTAHRLLSSLRGGAERGAALLHRMRESGLLPAEEVALCQLQLKLNTLITHDVGVQLTPARYDAGMRQLAAADVARHGLRRCALPSCDAQEPHPKLFKLCGRCRGAAYCCPGHSKEDWRRHKRAECLPAAPVATDAE
jgi:hypothetical protein